MKIGLATSVFSNYTIFDAVRFIAEAGYSCVDIWGGRPHVYRHDYSTQELKNLRNEIHNRGMFVSSFMPAFFRYPHSLCSSNPIIWEDSLDYVYQSMDNAAELGSPIFLVCPARILYGQDAKDAWERLANSLKLICERIKPYGMKVVLEPVNKNVFDLINNVADAIRMIDFIQAENIGVIIDSGHLFLSDESIEQAFTLVGDRLLQVHVNDNDGIKQQNLIPGDGAFDFDLFNILRQKGYNGVISAELSSEYGQNPFPVVEETARRLEGWLGK